MWRDAVRADDTVRKFGTWKILFWIAECIGKAGEASDGTIRGHVRQTIARLSQRRETPPHWRLNTVNVHIRDTICAHTYGIYSNVKGPSCRDISYFQNAGIVRAI